MRKQRLRWYGHIFQNTRELYHNAGPEFEAVGNLSAPKKSRKDVIDAEFGAMMHQRSGRGGTRAIWKKRKRTKEERKGRKKRFRREDKNKK